MKLSFVVLLLIVICGCECGGKDYNREFVNGQLVCAKVGGPIGIVANYDITGDGQTRVGFYSDPKETSITTQIGVGGSFFGGDGIVNSEKYYYHIFYEYELLHRQDCQER